MRWYYSLSGKAEGPVTFEFLIEQLKAGKFTLVDLVFKEGESAWKTFGEVPEFREVYQAPPPAYVPPQVVVPSLTTSKQEITLDEISMDEFTPTPVVANVHPISSFLTNETVSTPALSAVEVPDSKIAREFVKPEDGWPSDWRLSSSWIVLRKRPDGGGYNQEGPFSAEAIIEMIGQGKIEYAQYCWKPGYTRWFRIGNLPEFDRRKRDRENDTVNQIIPIPVISDSLPALSREELLSNVERLRREKRSREDQAPAGTNGPNLIETPLDAMAPAPAPAYVHEDAADFGMLAVTPTPEMTPTLSEPLREMKAPKTKSTSSPRYMRAVLATVIALIVAGVAFQILSSKRREPASAPAPIERKVKPTNTRTKTSDAAPVAPPAPALVPTIPKEAPKLASSLEIAPKDLETAPKLEFTTDMGPQDKISVKVKARTGEILTLGSFSKSYEIGAGSPPSLDLSKENLPAGTYLIEAQVGSAQTSTQIFIGKKDEHFTRELEHHLKSISLRQQSERSALYYGSQALETLAKDLAKDSVELKVQPLKWRKTFAVWRNRAREAAVPVIALSKAPLNEQTYPEAIAAFQLATDKLAAQAKDVDSAIAQKREVASAPSGEVAVAFGQLREDAAKLSGRPRVAD